jgi:hypothetical protein
LQGRGALLDQIGQALADGAKLALG